MFNKDLEGLIAQRIAKQEIKRLKANREDIVKITATNSQKLLNLGLRIKYNLNTYNLNKEKCMC